MAEEELKYDEKLEKLLKEQAEIAESLSILHRNAHRKYSRFTNWINIPVIVGSSVVGFTTGLDLSEIKNMNVILGILSVFIGIIKSLDSYFQLGRISETHRMVSLSYSQINKKIAVELALNRKDRISPKDMLSIIKTDIKNLEDISPLLPEDVIINYQDEFGNKYEHIKKPNITNGLSPVEVNTSGNITPGLVSVSADFVNKNNPDMVAPVLQTKTLPVLQTQGIPFSQTPVLQTQGIPIIQTPVLQTQGTPVNNIVVDDLQQYKTNLSISSNRRNEEVVSIANLDDPDIGEPM